MTILAIRHVQHEGLRSLEKVFEEGGGSQAAGSHSRSLPRFSAFSGGRGSTSLSRAPGCYPHQAFRVGDRAWGFQFHLEITEAMIRDWIRQAEEKSKAANPDWNANEVLTQTPCFLGEMGVLARKVFREFASLAKKASTR